MSVSSKTEPFMQVKNASMSGSWMETQYSCSKKTIQRLKSSRVPAKSTCHIVLYANSFEFVTYVTNNMRSFKVHNSFISIIPGSRLISIGKVRH